MAVLRERLGPYRRLGHCRQWDAKAWLFFVHLEANKCVLLLWMCALGDRCFLDRSWIRKPNKKLVLDTDLQCWFLWAHLGCLWIWHQFVLRAGWQSWTAPNSGTRILMVGFKQELIRCFFEWPWFSWLVNWRGFFPGAWILTSQSWPHFGITYYTQEVGAVPGWFIFVWTLMSRAE